METASNMIEIVEALGYRQNIFRLLTFSAMVNLLIWVVAILFADRVYTVMSYVVPDKIAAIVLGIPFAAGMFMAYCLFRLKMPTIEDNKHLDSDMMASFAYQSDSTKRWLVWIVSVVAGVVNVAILICANMYFADQL